MSQLLHYRDSFFWFLPAEEEYSADGAAGTVNLFTSALWLLSPDVWTFLHKHRFGIFRSPYHRASCMTPLDAFTFAPAASKDTKLNDEEYHEARSRAQGCLIPWMHQKSRGILVSSLRMHSLRLHAASLNTCSTLTRWSLFAGNHGSLCGSFSAT